jgi:hypothetical protein
MGSSLISTVQSLVRSHLSKLLANRDPLIPSVNSRERKQYRHAISLEEEDCTDSSQGSGESEDEDENWAEVDIDFSSFQLKGSIEAMSSSQFRLDIRGTPRSTWNKSAARVFAADIIEKLGLPDTHTMFQTMEKAFGTHLKHLMRKYRDFTLSAEARQLIRSKHNRYQRKYSVSSLLDWHLLESSASL